MLAYERGPAPLLNVAQSLFAFNDAHVRFVNARQRDFALIQTIAIVFAAMCIASAGI